MRDRSAGIQVQAPCFVDVAIENNSIPEQSIYYLKEEGVYCRCEAAMLSRSDRCGSKEKYCRCEATMLSRSDRLRRGGMIICLHDVALRIGFPPCRWLIRANWGRGVVACCRAQCIIPDRQVAAPPRAHVSWNVMQIKYANYAKGFPEMRMRTRAGDQSTTGTTFPPCVLDQR